MELKLEDCELVQRKDMPEGLSCQACPIGLRRCHIECGDTALTAAGNKSASLTYFFVHPVLFAAWRLKQ